MPREWHPLVAFCPFGNRHGSNLHNPSMRIEEVWHGRALGPTLLRALLVPASWLVSLGWRLYAGLYRLKLKRPQEPHRPVLCVGNLKVGGSGKSPVTLHLARLLRELGREVVVSASGYGSPRAESASLAPEGSLSPKEWGDEPAMLRMLEPELQLIVGRNRVRAAELCAQRFPNAVLLLDDGLQHLPLQKHLSILLEDPSGNGFCLPAGPYRQPSRDRWNVDLSIPGEFKLEGGLSGFRSPSGEAVAVAPARQVQVLCALGRPERFVAAIQAIGLEVEKQVLLPDHDPLSAGNLWESFEPDLPVVVTAKDWVKLRERPDWGAREIWIAEYDLHIAPAGAFRDWLERALGACAKKA